MKALKYAAFCLILLSPDKCWPERVDFRQLSNSCVAGADWRDVWAVVRQESGGRVWALSINRPRGTAQKLGYRKGQAFLKRQPRSREEALRWIGYLRRSGITVSVGLLQVSTEEPGVRPDELLDPCSNLRIGWRVFRRYYSAAVVEFGHGPAAIRAALSAYNSGSFFVSPEYAASVLRNEH